MLHHVRNRHPGREGRDLHRAWLEAELDTGADTTRRILHQARTKQTGIGAVNVPERVDIDIGEYHTLIRNGASLREDPTDICYSIHREPPRSGRGHYRKCAPLVDLVEPGAGGMLVKFAAADPNGEFPMHLASDGNRFEIGFFPDIGQPFHFGEGMGKTRDVLFNFHDDSLSLVERIHESANLSYPGVVGVASDVYRASGFGDVDKTLVRQLNKYPLLETKIDMLLAAQPPADHPRTSGWRDLGDEVGIRGRILEDYGIVQYINNEEDYLYCCMIEAWRRGRPFDGLSMARHLMDIDYIDYSEDPARNGAVCPHSENHTDGEVYPSHQWSQGLLYYYLATGDEEALRISRRIGDCLCWWITGPRAEALRVTGRETAWPLLSLAALYEVTHEERYKEAGMKVIDDMIAVCAEHGQLVWEYPSGSGVLSQQMLAMTFNGIWDMYAATGEARVLELWKTVTTPVLDQLADPDHWGYVHFRNWHIKWPDLTVLARWYGLTGDKKYIELGRNGLRLVMAGCPQAVHQSQGFFAMGYRHFILFLKLADEFGLIDDDQCTLVW